MVFKWLVNFLCDQDSVQLQNKTPPLKSLHSINDMCQSLMLCNMNDNVESPNLQLSVVVLQGAGSCSRPCPIIIFSAHKM